MRSKRARTSAWAISEFFEKLDCAIERRQRAVRRRGSTSGTTRPEIAAPRPTSWRGTSIRASAAYRGLVALGRLAPRARRERFVTAGAGGAQHLSGDARSPARAKWLAISIAVARCSGSATSVSASRRCMRFRSTGASSPTSTRGYTGCVNCTRAPRISITPMRTPSASATPVGRPGAARYRAVSGLHSARAKRRALAPPRVSSERVRSRIAVVSAAVVAVNCSMTSSTTVLAPRSCSSSVSCCTSSGLPLVI